MAEPEDIYAKMTPSGVRKDEFGTPVGAAGFDPNSTGAAAQVAAVEAARVARNASGGTPVITVAPDSRADEWNATFAPGGDNYSLTASQWNDAHPLPIYDKRGRQVNDQSFRETRQAGKDYHDATTRVVSDTLAAHKDISSADFVRKLSSLDSTHPDYPTQFADLVATHPTAGGKLVDQVIDHQENRRQVFNKAIEHGGASEFGSKEAPTPAYNSYVTTFAKTKDPAQARAAAELSVKNEAALDDAAKKGLLTEADFPKWDDAWKIKGSSRPKVYNADGTTNYGEVKKIIAAREGAGAGLKGQQDLVKEQDASIREFGKQLAEMDTADPNYAKVHGLWQSALDARTARMKGGAQPVTTATPATPGPAPTPSTKAQTVTQNGHTYTLQPDGSYK